MAETEIGSRHADRTRCDAPVTTPARSPGSAELSSGCARAVPQRRQPVITFLVEGDGHEIAMRTLDRGGGQRRRVLNVGSLVVSPDDAAEASPRSRDARAPKPQALRVLTVVAARRLMPPVLSGALCRGQCRISTARLAVVISRGGCCRRSRMSAFRSSKVVRVTSLPANVLPAIWPRRCLRSLRASVTLRDPDDARCGFPRRGTPIHQIAALRSAPVRSTL